MGPCLTAGLLYNLRHLNAHVAFIKNAFALFDEQYLRAFVPHIKMLGDMVGELPVGNEVEQVPVELVVQSGTFEPVQHHATDAATGTVLKNELRFAGRLRNELRQLVGRLEKIPRHPEA